MDGRQALVHGVEFFGLQVASYESLDAVEGDAREEGDVFEEREDVD